MNKEIKVKEYKKHSVLDAFKCYFFLTIIMAISSIVLQIVLSLIASSKGITYAEYSQNETVSIITYILSPIIMIAFFFIYNKSKKLKCKEAVSDGQKISLLPISVAIVLAIISIFLFTPLMNLIDFTFKSWGFMVDNEIPLTEKMVDSGKYFALGVLLFALLPAISEELIFRGIIQKGLSSKFNGFTTIIITTILFTLMHGSLQQTVYQILVGIMLSYLAYVGGNILYSIILHFLNNLLVLVFSCFDIVGYLSYDETIYYNIFSKIFPFLIFLLGVVLVGILFWVLKYLRNKDFFRFTSKKKNVEVVEEPKKVGFGGLWKSMDYNERVFMITGVILVGIVWFINTISGFMG